MDNNVAWKHVKAADMAPFRNQKQDASIPLTEAETILKKMLNCKEKASAGDEFDALDNEEIADNNNEPDQEDEASKEDSGVTPAVHGNSICLEKLRQSHRRHGAMFGKTMSKEGMAEAGQKKFEQKKALQNCKSRKQRLQNETMRCDSAVTHFFDREATGPGALKILLEGSTPFLEEEAETPEHMKLHKMALAEEAEQ
jgi:hypothetical protein